MREVLLPQDVMLGLGRGEMASFLINTPRGNVAPCTVILRSRHSLSLGKRCTGWLFAQGSLLTLLAWYPTRPESFGLCGVPSPALVIMEASIRDSTRVHNPARSTRTSRHGHDYDSLDGLDPSLGLRESDFSCVKVALPESPASFGNLALWIRLEVLQCPSCLLVRSGSIS